MKLQLLPWVSLVSWACTAPVGETAVAVSPGDVPDMDSAGDAGGGDDSGGVDPSAALASAQISNGGFEDQLAGWRVETGVCQITAERLDLPPHEGAAYLWGGEGQAGSCLAWQLLDLGAAGVPDAIDAGRVAVELEIAVASREVEGDFDDQPRLRIVWIGAEGEALGSLETLAGSGKSWHIRGATGLVPPGTREARVELDARLRRLPDNDAMMDDVQVRLHEVERRSPSITRQPMLQDHRTDAMRILWETDGNLADHAVGFGPAETGVDARQVAVRTIAVDDDHFVHVADIEDLSAGSAYAYQVESGDTVGALRTLRTAPAADAPTRIAWMADNQEGKERFATHIRHLAARDPDLLVLAGDLVSDMGSLEQWRDCWWAPLEEAEFGSHTPVLVARGNHDRHHPYAYAYTAMPEGEDFYSFRYGSVFVVTLDTQQPLSNQPPGLDQQTYLEAALASEAARSADFRVVVFHQAPYSNLRQDASDGNRGVRERWMDLIVSGGAELVIAGHYHSYQRGELDGVTHVVVGGGGSVLLGGPAEDLWSHMTLWEQAWHYSVMDVEDGRLSWVTYDIDDAVLDSFTLDGGPLE